MDKAARSMPKHLTSKDKNTTLPKAGFSGLVLSKFTTADEPATAIEI